MLQNGPAWDAFLRSPALPRLHAAKFNPQWTMLATTTHFEDSVAQYVTASVNLCGLLDLSARLLFQSTLWALSMANLCMICWEFWWCTLLTVVALKQEDRGRKWIARRSPLALSIKSNIMTCVCPVHARARNLIIFNGYGLSGIWWRCSPSTHAPFAIFKCACVAEAAEMICGTSVELRYLCLAFQELSARITGEEFVIWTERPLSPAVSLLCKPLPWPLISIA